MHSPQVDDVIVGDLILLELLQGAKDDRDSKAIDNRLRDFPVVNLLDTDRVYRAARNYRILRSRGATIRKTIDLIIGTYCIDHGHTLLHNDRDFTPMQFHLGLKGVTMASG